ncbi:MAG: sigma-70 family RNA polymerase sigma factor, partial [Clostridia bacterium]|nr:sigma-70 family RNA polymerase sigma factor [Clostridia bacterium]
MLAYLMMIDSDEGKARFTAIYDKYKNLMFHSAYKILKNTHDAEDIVHEAFIVAIENLDRLRDPDAPATRAFLLMVTE